MSKDRAPTPFTALATDGLDPEATVEPRARWAILGGLTLVTFLLLLDDAAVSVALPTIQRELGVGLNGLEWVIKAYSLTLAVFTLLAGRLADRDGRRRMFLIGLGSFVLGSPASGLAPSGGLLIAARAVKGLGAALVAPASLAIIAETFSKRERGMALGVWAGASASALGSAPVWGDDQRQPRLELDLLAQRAALLLRLAARPCRPSGVTRSSRPTEP